MLNPRAPWTRLLSLLFLFSLSCSSHAEPPAAQAGDQRFGTVYGADKFSKGPAPAWATAVAVPAAKPSPEPNTMRLADTQLRWDETGADYYFHRVLQANNSGGIQQLGQVQLDFNPAYQTMVLHTLKILRNDTVIDKMDRVRIRFLERELGLEQSVYNGSVTVALLIDDVRVGDALELSYSLRGANPVFKDIIADSISWEGPAPVQLRRVSIRTPRDRPVAWRFIGATRIAAGVKPTESKRGDFRELVFEQRDIPPFRFEDFYPQGYQPLTWLQISEYRDWNQVAQWAVDLFRTPADNGAEYQALVARLRAVADPAARAAQALDFVQSEIRYTSVSFGENSHRPATPDEVLERRYGDCKDKTLLLVSLYRALGLDAKPVLVGVAAHNGLNEWLPGTTPFDHAIVKLDLGKKTYWLDPTANQKPHNLDTLGRLHDGTDVLVVDARTDRLQTIERGPTAVYSVLERVHLDNLDGPALLEKSSTVIGATAELLRTTLAETPIEEVEKNLLNEVQRSYSEPERIGRLSIVDDPEKNTITYSSQYRIQKYAEKLSDGWILRHRPAYIASFFNIPDAPRRNAPYAVTYPAGAVYVHEVELPDGISITEPEAVQTVNNPAFSLRQSQQRLGRIARTEYTFATLAPAVTPAQMDNYIADIRRVQNEMHTGIFIGNEHAGRHESSAALERARARAERGDADAQFEVGLAYSKGLAVPRDFGEAYSWWLKAAQQNNARAQYYLGLLFETGQGVAQDRQAAAVWFQRAAEQNLPEAQFRLGALFADGGGGVQQDYGETLRWWTRAAQQGDVNAQVELGLLYSEGKGTARDYAKAYDWWKKAADRNSPIAQNNLGVLWEYGDGGKQDLGEAQAWYRKAAEQGYSQGQYNLGLMYIRGKGVQADMQQAQAWMRKAAEQGHSAAQFALGVMLEEGEGIAQDYKQARLWLLRAAEQKVAGAQFRLGTLYQRGLGIERDRTQARLWYERAALQDYGRAQYLLGLMLAADGRYVDAYQWLGLAEKNNIADANKYRNQLQAEMTAQQIEDAERRTRIWQAGDSGLRLVPAQLLRDSAPDYPAEARRLALEGEVVASLSINPKGTVDAVLILSSSGSGYLDDAARAAALRCVFTPATQQDVAVASQFTKRISFALNGDSARR